MIEKTRVLMLAATVLSAMTTPALAQKAAAVRETVDYVMVRFAAEMGEETAETLASRLARFAARHGDDALGAVRKVGPRAFRLVEEAGEHGPHAVRLLARYGDDAAWIITRPNRLTLFVQHGDDAAEAMIKHKDIVLPLIERSPQAAAAALKAVNGQNARRLAMMESAGELTRIGRTDRLMGVIARQGDKAADFIWRNKGALVTATALTAFLADPEPFMNGARDLASVAGEAAREPLREVVRGVNWTAFSLASLAAASALLLFRTWLRRPAGGPRA